MNKDAQALGKLGAGKKKHRSPEAQARITAAARKGAKAYWARLRAEKQNRSKA